MPQFSSGLMTIYMQPSSSSARWSHSLWSMAFIVRCSKCLSSGALVALLASGEHVAGATGQCLELLQPRHRTGRQQR